MMTIAPINLWLKTLWPSLTPLWSFFHRLQWKLTLAYALFTAVTALALGLVALALVWYFTFWSNGLPARVADDLLRTSALLSPYLEHIPSDPAGLNNWLRKAMVGHNLVVRVPPADGADAPPPPARFDRVISMAIVNPAGQVMLSYPAETFAPGKSMPVSAEAMPGFQAALQGQTDPAKLATRNDTGNVIATAPIIGSNGQLLGAIFIETAPPITESEFLQFTLRQTILPVFLGVLVVGAVAGVFFGYFIAGNLNRRLRTLANAADAWSNGDFNRLVTDNSGDELSQLAQRLNRMALQLQMLLQTRQELATLDERNRLARDLHDAVKQRVFATAMQVAAALTFFDQNPAAVKACLLETNRLVQQTQQELTSLIQELRPAELEDKGLTTALRDFVTDWSRQNNIVAEVRVSGEQALPFLLEQTLFRVAQEALANIARHSQATRVKVYLAWAGEQVTLIVVDNGRGFNPTTTNGKGLGLRSMRERVEAIGGYFSLTSQPEAGTRVTVHCNSL